MNPAYDEVKMILYFLWSPSQKSQSNREKNRKKNWEGEPTEYPSSIPQSCQYHQKQGMFTKMLLSIGALGDIRIKCDMVFWMGS